MVSRIVNQIMELKTKKIEVVLVSSGSMAAGRGLLRLSNWKADVVKRQVLSSIGQVKLIEAYSQILAAYQALCCQILVTKQDFRDRRHYLNMKNCFEELLHDQILPVVNENDAIAVEELMFTDNDELAALIAAMLDAEALLVLTSVAGIFDRHPDDPQAQVIQRIDPSTTNVGQYVAHTKTVFGRGGMHTKCRNAAQLAKLGITTHIASGKEPNALLRLVAGESLGTTFVPAKRKSSIKKWISSSRGHEKGIVWINNCAKEVLLDPLHAQSLLPVGVIKVQGEFKRGDIVQLRDEADHPIGLGVTRCDAEKAEQEKGQKGKRPLIHYDYLVILAQ